VQCKRRLTPIAVVGFLALVVNVKLQLLQERAKYRGLLRGFFVERGFLEVVTPLLVINPGLEPEFQYFETEFRPLMGRGERATLYLATSPEYHLKKALGIGAEKIFELTRAFRNGELGVQHSPEFEMLEWYRQPGTYEEIAKDVEGLLIFLWKHFHESKIKIRHKKVSECFAEHEIDLEEAQKDLAKFRQRLSSLKVECNSSDSFSDLFHRAFMQLIESKFTKDEILFLWDFPAPLRALSKLGENKYFCKRFEVYWGSVELANAFDELIDSKELREVCLADQKKRMERYGKAPPLDEEFILAHEKLKPQIGGIALGADRVFQWLKQETNLSKTMLFGRES
jgi:lysyl-tRNA synthetase class 2